MRINLTAEQSRVLNETGRVELWTEMEERSCKNCKWKSEPYTYPDWIEHTRKCLNFPLYDFNDWEPKELPHGPDGERWIAEPWFKWEDDEKGWIIRYVADVLLSGFNHRKNYPGIRNAESMPREASRANANITTTVEQRNGVWGFATIVERRGSNEN